MQPLNCVRVLCVEPVDGLLVLLRLPLQLLQASPQLGLLPLVQLVCFIKLDRPSSRNKCKVPAVRWSFKSIQAGAGGLLGCEVVHSLRSFFAGPRQTHSWSPERAARESRPCSAGIQNKRQFFDFA